ncbi:MAG: hypothetical protein AAF821_21540 [Cyanobacteria bacterium P01_D01_bin.156]
MSKTKITPLYAETRILLSLFAIGEDRISPSDFVPKGDKYQQALVDLVEDNCLSETLKGKRYKKYSLLSEGKEKLIQNLANEELSFFSSLGPKTTNGLLKVFRELVSDETISNGGSKDITQNGTHHNGNEHSITSYEAFTSVALDVYEQLNADFQCEDLVPIYRIRRTIGGQVSRTKFNEWLLKMQANDKLQLIGGEMPELTPEKAEDSVKTSLGGIRYYAKRL